MPIKHRNEGDLIADLIYALGNRIGVLRNVRIWRVISVTAMPSGTATKTLPS